MALPALWHFTGEHSITQGSDWYRTLGLKLDDGSYLNTAGYTARMQIRASKESPTVLLELTTGNGRIQVGIQGSAPNQYNVLLAVLGSISSPLTDWGLGYYDLELVDTFGVPQRIIEGNVTLNREVTR
jgi:hypothetical protein